MENTFIKNFEEFKKWLKNKGYEIETYEERYNFLIYIGEKFNGMKFRIEKEGIEKRPSFQSTSIADNSSIFYTFEELKKYLEKNLKKVS